MGVKYRTIFDDHSDTTWQVDISDATYSGSVIELNSSSTPLILRKDEDGVFQGTSAEISIEIPAGYTWGLTDLYSQTVRDHKVEIYKANILRWCGYLVPEEYQEPMIAPPFDITLRAVDGIGTLKNFDFPILIDNGRASLLTTILACLDKLDLDINIGVNIGISHESETGCVLAYTYIDASAFYNDSGEPLKCDEVITLILTSFDPNIYLTQRNGVWLIERHADIETGTTYNYTSAGVYVNTGSALSTIGLDSKANYTSSRCYPIGSLFRTFSPALKKMLVKQDYGLMEDIMHPIGVFDNRAQYNTMPPYDLPFDHKYWTDLTANGYISLATSNLKTYAYTSKDYWCGKFKVTDQLVGSGIGYMESDTLLISTDASNGFKLVLNVGWLSQLDPREDQIRVYLMCGSYYLSTSGWTLTESYLEYDMTVQEFFPVNFTELTALFDDFPADANLKVKIGVPWSYQDSYPAASVGGFFIKSMKVAPLTIATGIDTDVLINSGAIRDDEIDVYGDAPAPVNAKVYFKNVFLLDDDTATSSWKRTADSTYSNLNTIRAREIASDNRQAKQVYDGVIYGSVNLSYNRLIKHAYNSNAVFRFGECEYNVLSGEISGTLIEILPFVEPDYDIADSPIYTDATKTIATLSGDNDYVVFGGNVGAGKRIYQLETATVLTGKYIVIDKDGNAEAEKYPVEALSRVRYNPTTERMEILNNSDVAVMSIDASGNIRCKGNIYFSQTTI